jgi:hypothetical protein
MAFTTFFTNVRNSERWLAFFARRPSAWRARFLAWAELAKFITPTVVLEHRKIERRNMLVFDPFVNDVGQIKIGWLFACKPGKLLGRKVPQLVSSRNIILESQ